MAEETRVPGEKTRLTPSHWQLSHMPGWDSNLDSGDRQPEVSGSTLDHSAITAVPSTVCLNIITDHTRN